MWSVVGVWSKAAILLINPELYLSCLKMWLLNSRKNTTSLTFYQLFACLYGPASSMVQSLSFGKNSIVPRLTTPHFSINKPIGDQMAAGTFVN